MTELPPIEVPTTAALPSFEKPRIKKGYYPGKLIEVKPRVDKEGVAVLNKYGGQSVILLWQVYEQDAKTPLKHTVDNVEKDVILAQMCSITFKNDDGTIRTPFRPLAADGRQSFTAKTFRALGWEYVEDSKVNLQDYVGKFAELNIDDYDLKDREGKLTGKKASSIKDVNKWEGSQEPSKTSSPAPAQKRAYPGLKEPSPEKEEQKSPGGYTKKQLEQRMNLMDEMLSEGGITKEGHAKAMEQLKKEASYFEDKL